MKKGFFLFVLLFAFALVQGQEQDTKVIGVVINAANDIPLESVNIVNITQVLGTTTNEKGEFTFTNKVFKPSQSNYKYREYGLSLYGKALLESGDYSEAINVFNKSLKLEEEMEKPKAESLYYRGVARQKAGQSGFVKDFKEAAKLGSEKASEILETIA